MRCAEGAKRSLEAYSSFPGLLSNRRPTTRLLIWFMYHTYLYAHSSGSGPFRTRPHASQPRGNSRRLLVWSMPRTGWAPEATYYKAALRFWGARAYSVRSGGRGDHDSAAELYRTPGTGPGQGIVINPDLLAMILCFVPMLFVTSKTLRNPRAHDLECFQPAGVPAVAGYLYSQFPSCLP